MSDTVIRVENLWKEYRIGAAQGPYRTLRESLTDAVMAPVKRLGAVLTGKAAREDQESFWALKDVSFEVKRGEVVGIVGRNGAGKSTLLKILSRITEPTRGEIRIKGRVGALLEVGTGFHPELTGRENIFLNGALLGMKRTEIQAKFDEIVEFSEVSKFLDTPVKYYSSGMYVRLAFAVAAHLEPEVLIIDEVLAVGDAQFQKKCLGKMSDVASHGRTVLFVSHNAQAVRKLCSRAILLRAGEYLADGTPAEVLNRYDRENRGVEFTASTAVQDKKFRRGGGEVRFTSIEMQDGTGVARNIFEPGETVRFVLTYECKQPVSTLSIALMLRLGQSSEPLTGLRRQIRSEPMAAGEAGSCVIELPTGLLRPNEYPLYFWLGKNQLVPYDVVDGLIDPLVIQPRQGSELAAQSDGEEPGMIELPFNLVAKETRTTAVTASA